MPTPAITRAAPLLAALVLAGCGGGEGERTSAPSSLSEGSDIDLISISEAVWAREAEVGVGALSPAERVFLYVWNLEAEVNNGGFEQFYENSSGDHAAETPAALREIGATRVAAIVEEANSLFGPLGPPRDRDARARALERLTDAAGGRFDALDDRFFGYPDDLDGLLRQFVDQHRDQLPAPR